MLLLLPAVAIVIDVAFIVDVNFDADVMLL